MEYITCKCNFVSPSRIHGGSATRFQALAIYGKSFKTGLYGHVFEEARWVMDFQGRVPLVMPHAPIP